MILVDWQIKEQIQNGELKIDSWEAEQIGPASIDLRLSSESIHFVSMEYSYQDKFGYRREAVSEECITETKNEGNSKRIMANKGEFHRLEPKEFGLFSTIETITLGSRLCGQLEGRSSVGRQGLFIHNAGYIDPGFSGKITLEFFNATDSSLLIPVGMKICQLILFECEAPDIPYNKRASSKYLNQNGVTISRLEEEFNDKF